MVWGFWVAQALFWAVIGSFGTAYIHERQGRDVTMGGLMGMLVGFLGSFFLLVVFWVWLWYANPHTPVGRLYNARKRWYNWYN